MDLLHYGLQRSGTNYLKDLLLANFPELRIHNDGFSRSLPLQKHFRLYDEKWFIPTGHKYLNNFHYASVREFDEHLQHLTGVPVPEMGYIVIVKDPFSWYLSVRKEAKKMKWPGYVPSGWNTNLMIDYNLFHKKWLAFQEEAPERVLILNYEQFLLAFEDTMDRFAGHFQLDKKGSYQDVSKVFKSKKFTEKRKAYYRERRYMEEFDRKGIFLLTEMLDRDVVGRLGYELPKGGERP